MPSTIRVDNEFHSGRRSGGAAHSAPPNHKSYLGFVLGLIAIVVVVMGAIGWWLVQSGVVYIQINW